MKTKGTKFICDVCSKHYFVETGVHEPSRGIEESDVEKAENAGWKFGTEVGDLCGNCALQWEDWKSTFVQKIRKELKGNVV